MAPSIHESISSYSPTITANSNETANEHNEYSIIFSMKTCARSVHSLRRKAVVNLIAHARNSPKTPEQTRINATSKSRYLSIINPSKGSPKAPYIDIYCLRFSRRRSCSRHSSHRVLCHADDDEQKLRVLYCGL